MTTWKIYTEVKGVEYWYDRHERCWYAMRVDVGGNQTGDALDAYTKREILLIAKELGTGG